MKHSKQQRSDASFVTQAEERGHRLYAGVEVAHRSCGIAVAETFSRETAPYQALRKGGLTGKGECGAIVAGRLVLGELLGDPDPTGPPTLELLDAVGVYERLVEQRLERGNACGASRVCNALTEQFDSFKSAERHAFCTQLAAMVCGAVAESLPSDFDSLESVESSRRERTKSELGH